MKKNEVIHIKEVDWNELVNMMLNQPAWWGCRLCEYEEMVDVVTPPVDRICENCKDMQGVS